MSASNPFAPDIAPEVDHARNREATDALAARLAAELRASGLFAAAVCFPALDYRAEPEVEIPAPVREPQPIDDNRKAREARRAFADSLRARPRPSPGKFTIADLSADVCHFPLGDGPFLFCGAATDAEPYCRRHARIAYR